MVVYFHTSSTEVEYDNLRADPHVLVLARDTTRDRGPDVVVEGIAVRQSSPRCPASAKSAGSPGSGRRTSCW
ncbi:hypothetical protein GCM10027612_04210 [Microbispora bryophytorum subsp. camponoti]